MIPETNSIICDVDENTVRRVFEHGPQIVSVRGCAPSIAEPFTRRRESSTLEMVLFFLSRFRRRGTKRWERRNNENERRSIVQTHNNIAKALCRNFTIGFATLSPCCLRCSVDHKTTSSTHAVHTHPTRIGLCNILLLSRWALLYCIQTS